jgi:hypothetical protein
MRTLRFLLVAALTCIPAAVYAAETNFFGPIVPPCTEGGTAGLCQACNLVQLGQNILRFFVSLSVVAATVMFAYAGFLYVSASSNRSNLDSARTIFVNVFIGLILILTAYLIIDLTLKVLTGQPLSAISKIQCVKQERSNLKAEYTPVEDAPGQGAPEETQPSGGDTAQEAPPTDCGDKCEQGLANVDSSTNYTPVACQIIRNYSKKPGGDCAGMTPNTPGQRSKECLQGCAGSANGRRIITAADYNYCRSNPRSSLPEIKQNSAWQSFATVPCSQVKTVTVAIPQKSGITKGTKFTWPELADRYGLPRDTVFSADDTYASWGGYSDRGTYSVDLAKCGSWNTSCPKGSYNNKCPAGGSCVIKTRPTPVPGQ